MAKAIKITTAEGTAYSVKPIDGEQWGAYLPGESTATYVFTAPEDASPSELAGEVEYLEMTAEDTSYDYDSESDTEYDNEYDYA